MEREETMGGGRKNESHRIEVLAIVCNTMNSSEASMKKKQKQQQQNDSAIEYFVSNGL